MRIVVLGAGTVGTWIADLLCQNRHSVTVVDCDPVQTKRVNTEMDVRVVTGSASESSVLFQSDVIGADLCLAVTGVDEVNLVAASMAKAMGARRTIARVYGRVFRDMSTFDYQRHFNIDRLLSLEHLSALELARGIRSPGSLAVENLAGGQLTNRTGGVPTAIELCDFGPQPSLGTAKPGRDHCKNRYAGAIPCVIPPGDIYMHATE